MSMSTAKQSEIDIQNKICLYLEKKGYFFMRLNNTPVHDRKMNNGYGGYRSQGKWAAPGMSDILLLDKEKYGQAVFLEVKTNKTKQSPDQKLFEKRCLLNNCEYHIVRSVEDVKALKY